MKCQPPHQIPSNSEKSRMIFKKLTDIKSHITPPQKSHEITFGIFWYFEEATISNAPQKKKHKLGHKQRKQMTYLKSKSPQKSGPTKNAQQGAPISIGSWLHCPCASPHAANLSRFCFFFGACVCVWCGFYKFFCYFSGFDGFDIICWDGTKGYIYSIYNGKKLMEHICTYIYICIHIMETS
jgi:hypothetical protein